MSKKRVYISGGMSNIPKKNKPMFDKAERYLKKKGYITINPAAKPNEILDRDATEKEYLSFMREDIFEVLFNVPGISKKLKRRMITKGGVNEIWTLPNWQKSRGAKFEVLIGRFFRLKIVHFMMEEFYGSKKKRRRS